MFVEQTSKFVFNVSLPALIFLKISTIEISSAFDPLLIALSFVLVIVFAIFSWFLALTVTKKPKEVGVFTQGSFRSNFAIIGLALIANLSGEKQLGKASLLLAFIMPLYNILGVVFLTIPFNYRKKLPLPHILYEIIKNPLIIAALLAAPFSIFHLNPGSITVTTLSYLSKIALPLALIGIGASLNIKNLKKASKLSFIASFNKLITFPLIAIFLAYLLNFDKNQTVILFVLFASPTAIVSFIMADTMGSNSKLASDIIVISTLFSVITISTGIIFLKLYSLI